MRSAFFLSFFPFFFPFFHATLPLRFFFSATFFLFGFGKLASLSPHVGFGIVPVDVVGRILYGHCLCYASPVCLITCILFQQSIFLHLILYLLFPRLFRSSFSTTSKPSLSHFHLLSSKHDGTTVYCLLWPSYLKTPLCPTCPSTPRCFFDLIASHHTHIARIIVLSVLLKIAISFSLKYHASLPYCIADLTCALKMAFVLKMALF